MEYFVRIMEMHRDSEKTFLPEVACAGLHHAREEAKRQALASPPERMVQADACLRARGRVVTKYRCRIDARGELHEYVL